jgi:hypothetical protein
MCTLCHIEYIVRKVDWLRDGMQLSYSDKSHKGVCYDSCSSSICLGIPNGNASTCVEGRSSFPYSSLEVSGYLIGLANDLSGRDARSVRRRERAEGSASMAVIYKQVPGVAAEETVSCR